MQFSLGQRKRGGQGQAGGKAVKPRAATQPEDQPQAGGAWPDEKQRTGLGASARGETIPRNIEETFNRFAAIFHFPESKDVHFRKFVLPTRPQTKAFIIYVEGLTDSARVEREILYPLMRLPRDARTPKSRVSKLILNSLLPVGGAERKFTVEEVVTGLLKGEVAIFLDTGPCAYLADVKLVPARQPGKPVVERALQGPQLGFVENVRISTAMVRHIIRDPDLVVEDFVVGRRTRTIVSLLFIKDIANPKLVAEVRNRLGSVDVDGLSDPGELEQYLSDHPVTPVPLTLTTERPDRTARQLLQGAVAMIVDGSPRALIAPITFSTLLHSVEDTYSRAQQALFIRVLRLAALTVAIVLPGLYIAVLDFHREMLPSILLLAFVSAEEAIAAPLVLSVILMELSFELIREAGVRIPSAIGPTIGIVGALLIGDMAVRATLVSPITVIVVALTALSSFAIPDQATVFAARLLRFVFIGLAAAFGLYGVALGIYLGGVHLASLRSFGVPFLSPIGPWRPGSPDVILRGPQWKQEKRPIFLRPLDLVRQARYSRGWDPGLPDRLRDRGRSPEPTKRRGRGKSGK